LDESPPVLAADFLPEAQQGALQQDDAPQFLLPQFLVAQDDKKARSAKGRMILNIINNYYPANS